MSNIAQKQGKMTIFDIVQLAMVSYAISDFRFVIPSKKSPKLEVLSYQDQT